MAEVPYLGNLDSSRVKVLSGRHFLDQAYFVGQGLSLGFLVPLAGAVVVRLLAERVGGRNVLARSSVVWRQPRNLTFCLRAYE